MIKEIGFYKQPKKVGYTAWIKTPIGNWFVTLEGKIVGPYN
jgi:hypothetical protein